MIVINTPKDKCEDEEMMVYVIDIVLGGDQNRNLNLDCIGPLTQVRPPHKST